MLGPAQAFPLLDDKYDKGVLIFIFKKQFERLGWVGLGGCGFGLCGVFYILNCGFAHRARASLPAL